MGTCYNCDEILNVHNTSDEHILLNAVGGRLKSKSLLCKKCNSEFGSNCDSKLADQFLFLTSHLQIKKHRGDINSIKGGKTASGEDYNIINGSKPIMPKPVFEKIEVDGKINYKIQARDEAEMRLILKGIAKKNPSLNVDEAMKKA